MTVTLRFAPSPTGLLHVGNARVALINWLFAKAHGGYLVLRIDDTDAERSRPEFEEAIRRDLSWLGLGWDRRAYQSRRLDHYTAAAERMKEAGRLYPCYETPEELEARRKRRLSQGLPPVYDRAALKLSPADRFALEKKGRKPHWRFRLFNQDVGWDDMVRGECHYHADHLSDPVVIREDGTWLYTFTSVVDDVELGITHVIRGEDHVTNTAVQVQIFQALGAEPPAFGHLPLLVDAAGQGLSKRLGSLSLASLREQGLEPMAINSLLARLGTSEPVRPFASLGELVGQFEMSVFGRAAPRFDPAELEHLNARLLHGLSFAAVRPRLEALGLAGADEAFWLAVRPNLARLGEAAEWWCICRAPVAPQIEDAGFSGQAAALLPPEPWDETTWGAFAAAVKDATGRKGKALFHPLRLALTGRDTGPELKTLLPLIGRARAEARLRGETA